MTQSNPLGRPRGTRSQALPFDATMPNPARMWNYWVGGKDHFAADREAAQQIMEAMPQLPVIARMVRRFLINTVHELASEHGIRQFLDIGTGLPTADNTHDVAQRVAPEARIVYADYDPVVLSHAQALLTSSPEGKTDYIQADLRDTDTILSGATRTLDFGQPVAVLLLAILHFIPDHDDPYGVVGRLTAALPSGSYLVICHAASDIEPEAVAEHTRRYNERAAAVITPRSHEQVARFFDGLDLGSRGLVPLIQWLGADQADASSAGGLAGYCGIGAKR